MAAHAGCSVRPKPRDAAVPGPAGCRPQLAASRGPSSPPQSQRQRRGSKTNGAPRGPPPATHLIKSQSSNQPLDSDKACRPAFERPRATSFGPRSGQPVRCSRVHGGGSRPGRRGVRWIWGVGAGGQEFGSRAAGQQVRRLVCRSKSLCRGGAVFRLYYPKAYRSWQPSIYALYLI